MNRMMSLLVVGVLGLAACGMASAQDEAPSGLGLYAIGASGAYNKPGTLGGTFGVVLHADVGEIRPGFVLFPEISYWSKSRPLSSSYSTKYNVKYQELGLQGNVHYYLNPEASTNYYVGAGLGLFSYKASASDSEYNLSSDVEKKSSLGLNLLGGFETPIGARTRLVAEGRYKIDGRNNMFQVKAGMTLELSK
jgi:hypothetical protein